MTTGWGVLGTGIHASRSMGPAIGRAANTKLVAACDLTMELAKPFADKHGAKAYDSYPKMLEDPELDVVYVATPHNLHVQHTIQAAEAGKNVRRNLFRRVAEFCWG